MTPINTKIRKSASNLSSASKTSIQLEQPLFNPGAYKSIDTALRSIFPEATEENKLTRARRILGELASGVTDEELEIFTNEVQFLIDHWLDSYEKKVFEGSTLQQVIREG